MTEPEWWTCADPTPMLAFVRGKVSDRKLRLFAVWCCRELLDRIIDPFSRKALRIAERFADGEVDEHKLRLAWESARQAAQRRGRKRQAEGEITAMCAFALVAELDMDRALRAVDAAALASPSLLRPPGYLDHRVAQAARLRDIVGNPFRPVAFDARWRTADVRGLARGIYEDRAFDRMPLLADALMDAGCDTDDILTHCRGDGPHVRGCWVVDLLLGKE